MKKHKRKYIDKKDAVTFHLVHRSQHDPLITDETAPQRVFVESGPFDKEKRSSEQKKFGVFFDDDYNYLQHLKEPGKDVMWEYVAVPSQSSERHIKKPNIQLPSSVFASEFQEEEGMLNKAAPRSGPRPDWDPDIVAALDEDYDFDGAESELEDDFVAMAMRGSDIANGTEKDPDQDLCSNESMLYSDEEELLDCLEPLMSDRQFFREETKSRFTEYSMSSSVIYRNEQLTLLDDRFENFYASYDDRQMGSLDTEEIEGHLNSSYGQLKKCYDDLKKGKAFVKYNPEWDKERVKKLQLINLPNEENVYLEVEDQRVKKWDCDSILSTYSNVYNHPKIIEEPKKRPIKISVDTKRGLPANLMIGKGKAKLTVSSLAKFALSNANPVSNNSKNEPKSLCDQSVLSAVSLLSLRPKNESNEEKRQRKCLLREYRAERRMEKKANANAFKEEKKIQDKIKINIKNNLNGNKIL